MNLFDPRTLWLIGAVLMLLGAAETIVRVLGRRPESGIDTAILETFRLRVHAWWILFAILAAAFLLGHWTTVVFFGLISFWALREFITLTPTRPGDHRTLFWVFFLCTPLQFWLVGMGYYSWYSIAIPVYAFLFIPARIALAGDYKRFLERTAKIQTGLLICVYCLSYAPALLTVPQVSANKHAELASSAAKSGGPSESNSAADLVAQTPAGRTAKGDVPAARVVDAAGRLRLLFFFILMVQLSDALQYAWSQLPSKHVIVPTINATRTWEGLLGGTASVTLLGAILSWATPFPDWWMAGVMSAVIALMGFAGGITMSAMKRDRGVKDFGTLVEGHGGVLDRIDSLCFAAPVFFHLTVWWLG
ncbi:MAG: phosphatidate cytidylyltransferase [Planctomycetaceae bacterium]|nr:phosphatidate cytidylyltransferase [Planctomycetaceae bacterium]